MVNGGPIAELTKQIAAGGEDLALKGQKEGVGFSAGHLPHGHPHGQARGADGAACAHGGLAQGATGGGSDGKDDVFAHAATHLKTMEEDEEEERVSSKKQQERKEFEVSPIFADNFPFL